MDTVYKLQWYNCYPKLACKIGLLKLAAKRKQKWQILITLQFLSLIFFLLLFPIIEISYTYNYTNSANEIEYKIALPVIRSHVCVSWKSKGKEILLYTFYCHSLWFHCALFLFCVCVLASLAFVFFLLMLIGVFMRHLLFSSYFKWIILFISSSFSLFKFYKHLVHLFLFFFVFLFP